MSDYLTTSEAAALLEVSVATLKRWTGGGLIPSERTTGGHRRFRRGEVDRFVRSTRDGDPVREWAEAISSRGPVALQARILEERSRLGSWWEVAESLVPVQAELHRRHSAGALTTVEWQAAFERLRQALCRFLDHLAPRPGNPQILIAAVPGDRILLPATVNELCAGDSGWITRFAGQASAGEAEEDLRRAPARALLVTASLGCDHDEVVRHAAAYQDAAARLGVPLGFAGLGTWPKDVPGTVRLESFAQTRGWLESCAVSLPTDTSSAK